MGVEGRGPGSFAQLRRQQLPCAPSCCRQSQTCSCYLCPVFQRSLQSLFCYEIYPFLNIGNLCKLLLKIHLNQQTQLQAGCCLQTIHRNKTWVQTGEAACQGHPHVGTGTGTGPPDSQVQSTPHSAVSQWAWIPCQGCSRDTSARSWAGTPFPLSLHATAMFTSLTHTSLMISSCFLDSHPIVWAEHSVLSLSLLPPKSFWELQILSHVCTYTPCPCPTCRAWCSSLGHRSNETQALL